MVIVINGPLGIGKTTTSWALLERIARAVMLDGDYVTALHPFDYHNAADLAYAYSTFHHLIAFHAEHGYRDFVINWVFETPEQLALLREAIAPLAGPVVAVRLTCSPGELERRVRQRNNGDLAWELQRSQQLHGILEGAAQRGDLGVAVDTSDLSVEQVCDRVLSIAKSGAGK